MHNTGKETHPEFNIVLLEAIDRGISDVLGPNVLQSLYDGLARTHSITRDELPYHLETCFEVLQNVFGVRGAKTIGRNIAHRLYEKLGFDFEDIPYHSLNDYIESAKRKLAEGK